MKKRLFLISAAALMTACSTLQLDNSKVSDEMIFQDELEASTEVETEPQDMPSDLETVNAQLSQIDGQILSTKAEMARLQNSSNKKESALNLAKAQADLQEFESQKAALSTHKENLELSESLE